MILLFNKTIEDLNSLAMSRLQGTKITERGPGGIARLLLAIINENVAGFYNTLTINHTQAFLSTATGECLDAIGYMLSCLRLPSEVNNDDAFRTRISQQVLVMAAANETSIRLAALSIEEVQDVHLKPYSFGTGSFNMYILTKDAITPNHIIEKVREAVTEVVGYGTKFDVTNPELVPLEAKFKLMFTTTTDEITQQSVRVQARDALKEYFNSRAIGEPIIIHEITQRVMEVSEGILNYQLYELRVNGRRVLNVDQNCRWNERFIESSNPEAILVS